MCERGSYHHRSDDIKIPVQLLQATIFEELPLTCVEGTVRSLFIYSVAHPLGNDFLLPLINGASWMLCESIICEICQRIKVTEENSTSTIRLDMNIGVLKVGKSTLFWNGAENK